ncbi:EthD domain-containing protein [Aspergillus saccharolyticus JOP 1030-1]|uniref:EthD domain-containing protein n=1 Tax=Aspergillus saccharolyticus JOP 1030-1 TaxID=1450539 RepID=A0A319A556_9EURO|nr:hypothetical protein BP01DRAFT_359419 [Aspergillus saccharolyticus JOP 1030-1]PYH42542.1 hypothetical protein BP01DRAFT_359419 [Aspergillus saccharolyticus JOP 1030-1]
MPLTVIVFLQRKVGVTPQDFKNHYENHMLLAKEIAGSTFPTLHKRLYLTRTPQDRASSDPSNANHLPTVFAGQPADFSWDVLVEMVFNNMEHFQAFQAALAAQGERIANDEQNFLDQSRMYVAQVDDSLETRS